MPSFLSPGSPQRTKTWTSGRPSNVPTPNWSRKDFYLTHLFRELEVILTPDWLKGRVHIPLELDRLTVFRPAPLDLILTKMARGDENDLDDIRFLLGQECLTPEQLRAAFSRARVPDVLEIHELFQAAQPKVLALAATT